MKKMKRAVTLLVAMIMVLSMSLTAFAENSTDDANKGKIIITNPAEGETYKAYKIFDVAYSAKRTDVNGYTYTISKDSEWLATVQEFASNVENGMILTESGDVHIVTVDNAKFSAAVFSAVLKAAGVTDKAITFMQDGDTLVASNLPLGYYFVTSTLGSLCNLTTTEPEVNIRDKNAFPAFEKKDNQRDVEVGDVVIYTIESLIPDTTGYNTFTYKISDTMSDGLTFDKDSLKITIGDADYTGEVVETEAGTPEDKTKIAAYYTANGFVLTFPVMEYQANAGEKVKVTYTATVNEKAIAQVEENDAKLVYSNNPQDETSTGTMDDKEKVYSSQIVINKTDDEGATLAGAVFVLQNDNGQYYQAVYDEKQTPAVLTDVNWVDAQDNATRITTDANGVGTFGGLKDGSYTLTEIEAPEGYNKLTDSITIEINGDEDANGNEVNISVDDVHNDTEPKDDETILTHTENVINEHGPILPETGGIGTVIFYVVGAILVIGGSVVLITRNRMSERK